MIKITPYYERPNAAAILKCYLNLVADVVPFRPEDVLYGVEIEPDSLSNTPRKRYFRPKGGNQERISAYVKLLNDKVYKIDPDIPARDQDALLAKAIISRYSSNLYEFLYDKPSSDKPGAVNRENLRRLLTTTFHQGNTPYEYSEKTPGTAALLRDHVFRYDAFSQKRYPETKRSVYQLLTLLGVSVCPYCNRQYITTVIHGRQSVRPQIDHFFCKKDYPYLALSINNLVPSCSVCNLQKHDRNKKILYPYEEELGESFIFRARYIDKQTDEKKHKEYLIDQAQGVREGVARFDLKSGIEEKNATVHILLHPCCKVQKTHWILFGSRWRKVKKILTQIMLFVLKIQWKCWIWSISINHTRTMSSTYFSNATFSLKTTLVPFKLDSLNYLKQLTMSNTAFVSWIILKKNGGSILLRN